MEGLIDAKSAEGIADSVHGLFRNFCDSRRVNILNSLNGTIKMACDAGDKEVRLGDLIRRYGIAFDRFRKGDEKIEEESSLYRFFKPSESEIRTDLFQEPKLKQMGYTLLVKLDCFNRNSDYYLSWDSKAVVEESTA